MGAHVTLSLTTDVDADAPCAAKEKVSYTPSLEMHDDKSVDTDATSMVTPIADVTCETPAAVEVDMTRDAIITADAIEMSAEVKAMPADIFKTD